MYLCWRLKAVVQICERYPSLRIPEAMGVFGSWVPGVEQAHCSCKNEGRASPRKGTGTLGRCRSRCGSRRRSRPRGPRRMRPRLRRRPGRIQPGLPGQMTAATAVGRAGAALAARGAECVPLGRGGRIGIAVQRYVRRAAKHVRIAKARNGKGKSISI